MGRLCKINSGATILGLSEKSKHSIELKTGVVVGANACITASVKLGEGEVVPAGSVLS